MSFKNLFKSTILSIVLLSAIQSDSDAMVVPQKDIENYAPISLPWKFFETLKSKNEASVNAITYEHTDKAAFQEHMPSFGRSWGSYALSFVSNNTTLAVDPTFKSANYEMGDDYVTLTYHYAVKKFTRGKITDLTFKVKLSTDDIAKLNQKAILETPRAKIDYALEHIQGKLLQGFNEGVFDFDYYQKISYLTNQKYDEISKKVQQIELMPESKEKQDKIAEIAEYTKRVMENIDDAYDRESDKVKVGGKKSTFTNNNNNIESDDEDSDSDSDDSDNDDSNIIISSNNNNANIIENPSNNIVISSNNNNANIIDNPKPKLSFLDQIKKGKQLGKVDATKFQKVKEEDGDILRALLASTIASNRDASKEDSDDENQNDWLDDE